ncbi:MAG: hypothetical protein ABIF01_05595 [Candidatus Micrarchaeota archaeon]
MGPSPIRKTDSNSIAQNVAEAALKEFASKKGYGTPAEILSDRADRRNSLLSEFCAEGLKSFTPGQIAEAIIKWRYPAKILSYHETNKDQAASAIVLGITSKVNLFDMFNGGIPVVENGKLLNGVFGRTTTNYMVAEDTLPDVLYLTNHALEKELPQPPLILFVGRCSKTSEFAQESAKVVQSREQLESELGHLMVEEHRLKIADKKHDSTVKFRLLCVVWDSDAGKLMVVSSKRDTPTPFVDWVTPNLNSILSASDGQLGAIKSFAEESGLLEKLRNPKNGNSEYNPWAELLQKVEKSEGVTEPIIQKGDAYRQAVKIWRYATLQIAVENTKLYEQKWASIKVVSDILTANTKLACDDGRQSGDVNVLGAIVTKAEFSELFGKSNQGMETLRFVPHYNCGFLTGCHQVHLMLERLQTILNAETNAIEKQRMSSFFIRHLKRFATEVRAKPVEPETLRDYLPAHLAQELDDHLNKIKTKNPDNRKFVEAIHELFAAPGDRLRTILRRGIETEVFKQDQKTGFVSMVAADTVYRNLFAAFGEGYLKKFTFNQVNSLVIEEASRTAHENYSRWAGQLSGRGFRIEFFMDNFITGQATVVPERPQAAADLEDLRRYDHYLTTKFTPQEVTELGLKEKTVWEIPK